MRRPLLCILILYALGIVIQYTLHMKTFVIGIALLLSVLLLVFSRHNHKMRLVFLLMAVTLLSSCYFQLVQDEHSWMSQLEGKKVVVEGYVKDVVVKSDTFYKATLHLDTINYQNKWINCDEKILVNLSGKYKDIHQLIGEKIELRGTMTTPETNRNPKCFNYQLYLKTKKIHMMMDAKTNDLNWKKGNTKLFTAYLGQFKYDFQENIRQIMSQNTSGVLIGLLFGDKQFIDDDIYDDFRKNGTAHILAVSGIHVGILYGLLQVFGKKKNYLKDIFTILLLFTYAFVSGFSPSVTRATTMIIFYMLSCHMHRGYDLISSVSLTALLFLLYNPYAIFDVGFQLSFTAVFAVGITYPYLKKKIKCKNGCLDMLILLVAIQLATMPLIAYHFNFFSVSAFFVNIPVILSASVALPIAFLMLPLSYVGYVGGKVFLWVALLEEMFLEALIYMNEFSTILFKGVLFDVMSPPISTIVIYFMVLLLVCYEVMWESLKPYKEKILLIGIVAIIVTFQFSNQFNPYELVFVDVGQGDCIHVKTPKGKNILIDGGGNLNDEFDVGEKILLPYLLKNGVNHIEMAFISHLHEDHYKGIISLMSKHKVKRLVLPANAKHNTLTNNIEKLAKNQKIDITYLEKNDRILVEDHISITVYHPKKKSKAEYNEDDENNQSLVLLLDYQGRKVLLTGDIEEEIESLLVDEINGLGASILKVPHHGSNTSSTLDFIQKVTPEIAVIQVGKNNLFGHPSKEILQRYQNEDISIYRNDKNGAVMIDIKKDELKIKTMLDGGKDEL